MNPYVQSGYINAQPHFLAAGLGIFFMILPLLIIWSLIWKGWALWIAARQSSKVWFVVLLIVNTLGILDILYIYIFSKSKNKIS